MVGGIFSWPTLGPSLPAEHLSMLQPPWMRLLTMSIPPWPPWTIPWGLLSAEWRTMSQRSHHLTLVSGPWPWVDSWTVTPVASSLSRSQSNRAALGRVVTGDSPHRCAATLWCSHVIMEWTVCGTRLWPSRVTEAGSGDQASGDQSETDLADLFRALELLVKRTPLKWRQ